MQNPDALSLHSRAWRLYPSMHLWVTYGWVYVGVCVCVRIFFVHNDCAVSSQDHDRFFVNAATPIADGLRRDPNSICCSRHHDRPLVNISYNYLDISLLSALLFPAPSWVTSMCPTGNQWASVRTRCRPRRIIAAETAFVSLSGRLRSL